MGEHLSREEVEAHHYSSAKKPTELEFRLCLTTLSLFAERDALQARVTELERENMSLRAALAQSELPCAYCTLPKEEWAKCQSGFPGCARADDAMGCPELGASLRALAAEARCDVLRKALEELVASTAYKMFAGDDGNVMALDRPAPDVWIRARAALQPSPTAAVEE